MHRNFAIEALTLYRALGLSVEDEVICERVLSFINSTPHCFERENIEGHVTASALITNPTMDRVILTLHKKLGKWLQLGGHADGESRVEQVALKEAQEESGLAELRFLMKAPNKKVLPFDLDVHEIPERSNDPAHLHYDFRYLLVADSDDILSISEESTDLKWFSLDEAYELNLERSVKRQFEKLEILREQLKQSVLVEQIR